MYQVLSFTPTLQMRKLRHSDDKYIVQDHRVSRARIGTHGLTVELPLLNHGAFSLVAGPAASVCRQKANPERGNGLARIENCLMGAEQGPNPDEESGAANA